jgi:hypothetical protein
VRKLIVFVFVAFVLVGCGVDTSSNPQGAGTIPVDVGNEQPDVGVDYIYRNPVVIDQSTDGNTTNPDNNTTPGVDPDAPVADQNNSIFDVSGAVEDKFACMIGNPNAGYTNNSISDTSSDDRSGEDLEDGVLINSKFPLDRTDPSATLVSVFYYDLKPQRDAVFKNIYENRYRLSVDTAWGRNNETVMYVMTPQNIDGYFGCYRYDFSSLTDGTFSSTKVYRNNI